MAITELKARPEAETLVSLHEQGAEVRVLAPSHAVYAPLLTARQVAVEPWRRPRLWQVGRWRELRRLLTLYEPDRVLLRGSAVRLPLLIAVSRARAQVLVFLDLFEGDAGTGLAAPRPAAAHPPGRSGV